MLRIRTESGCFSKRLLEVARLGDEILAAEPVDTFALLLPHSFDLENAKEEAQILQEREKGHCLDTKYL